MGFFTWLRSCGTVVDSDEPPSLIRYNDEDSNLDPVHRAAACRMQSRVTASAGVSGPGSIASASRRNCATSARQAWPPSSLRPGPDRHTPGCRTCWP